MRKYHEEFEAGKQEKQPILYLSHERGARRALVGVRGLLGDALRCLTGSEKRRGRGGRQTALVSKEFIRVRAEVKAKEWT
jgi:hypothetical protein